MVVSGGVKKQRQTTLYGARTSHRSLFFSSMIPSLNLVEIYRHLVALGKKEVKQHVTQESFK